MRQLAYSVAKIFGFPFGKGFGRLVQMKEDIDSVGGITFDIKVSQDGWIAESIDVPGIITGGSNPQATQEEIDASIKDAIFTAYAIPAFLCDDNLLESESELVRRVNGRRNEKTYSVNENLAYSM